MYTILLADDRVVFMRQLKRFRCLKNQKDFQVRFECQNGAEALEILKREKVDLVITDIRMPLMDGIELLQAVKEGGLCNCVVLLSEYADFEYAKRGLVLGAFDYCLKPIDNENLASLLERAKDFLDCIEKENYYQADLKLLVHAIFKQDGLYLETAEKIFQKIRNRSDSPELRFLGMSNVLEVLRESILRERPWFADYYNIDELFRIPNTADKELFLTKIRLIDRSVNEFIFKNCGQLIEDVCITILENIENGISLQKLAEEHFVNKTYLSNIFKGKTGMPLNEYITNVKMKRAVMLLGDSGEKIMVIAGRLGFEDAEYFSRLFKIYFGMTPSEYRRNAAKEAG